MRHRPIPLALGLALSALIAVGCTEEEKLPARNPAAAASSSSAGVGGSGEGGAGSGGSGANGGSGNGGGSDGGAAPDWPCVGNLALESLGASFAFPTPEGLTPALNALSYDPSTHPFGLLLEAASPDALVASSAIHAGAFVGDAPEWGPASFAGNTLSAKAALATGSMRLATDGEPVDVPLTQITFAATMLSDCSGAFVRFDAILPAAAGELELPTDDGPKTILDLAGTPGGPMGGGEEGWTLRALFDAQATNFDFGSAP